MEAAMRRLHSILAGVRRMLAPDKKHSDQADSEQIQRSWFGNGRAHNGPAFNKTKRLDGCTSGIRTGAFKRR